MTGNANHRRPTPEQRAFFEALVGFRARYGARGDEDASAVMSLRHAMAAANAAMAELPATPIIRLGLLAN